MGCLHAAGSTYLELMPLSIYSWQSTVMQPLTASSCGQVLKEQEVVVQLTLALKAAQVASRSENEALLAELEAARQQTQKAEVADKDVQVQYQYLHFQNGSNRSTWHAVTTNNALQYVLYATPALSCYARLVQASRQSMPVFAHCQSTGRGLTVRITSSSLDLQHQPVLHP